MTKLLTTLILTYDTTEQQINSATEKTDRHDFISILNFSVLNLFCRWFPDQTVPERLKDIWPSIKKVDDFWQKLPNCKQPKSKSYDNLHDAVIDLLTSAKLNFFSYVATFFQPFLTLYQTDNPMVPFLYDDLMKFVKKSCCLFSGLMLRILVQLYLQ